MDDCIIVDWLSFTSKIDSISSILRLLGLEECTIKFESTYGVYGYHDRLAWDGININFNGHRDDMGIFVELSGQGCRHLDESSNLGIFHILHILNSDKVNYNITRLDLAFDDRSGLINMNKIISDIHKFNFVSKFNTKSIRVEEHAGHVGQTIYFGSNKSNVMFRIYDKKFERNREDDSSCPHWVRFEIQLRSDRASLAVYHLCSGTSCGDLFSGIVNNYIRFLVPSSSDSNKKRWKTAPYWLKIVKSVEKISLFTKKDTEYNLRRCERYVHQQCSNAVEALINAKGVEHFLSDMISDKPPLSEKYKCLSDNTGVILDFLKERGVLNV